MNLSNVSKLLKQASWLPLVGCALVGAVLAGGVQQLRIDAVELDLATLKTNVAVEQLAASEAAKARLTAAQERADALTQELLMHEQSLTQLKERKDHEIKRLTTGNVCFNAATVRLLNATSKARNDAATLPPPTSEPVAESAAIATDTDVASYINIAQDRFEVCRAKLDALIDWHMPETVREPAPTKASTDD